MITDEKFLRQAIANSKKSLAEGNFPAGAIVVLDNEIIASAVSSPYPGLFHADSKAVTEAFSSRGSLKGATLYISLESCLMCTGVAYWSGLRRIVYAIPKSKVSGDYYETPVETAYVLKSFNEPIEMIHVSSLEAEALAIVREWELKHITSSA